VAWQRGRLAAWQGWQVVKTRNSWDRPKERERRGGVGRAIDKHGARCWRRIQGKGIRQGSDYAGSGMDGGPAAAMGGTVNVDVWARTEVGGGGWDGGAGVEVMKKSSLEAG
jgi:hypothetical protein